jgi:hypothetical protein
MHLRLDPVGGVAGDMFIAAILDAFPELEHGTVESIRAVLPDGQVTCRVTPHRDRVLRGSRFLVEERHHRHGHEADTGHAHAHATWASIRARLQESQLDDAVRAHAIGIFALLAEAEARVHGVPVEDVAFHEVGAVDSIADIVGAAHLIAALGPAARWTAAPVPLGSGRVRTAHGLMPVPAPATALLLEGFAVVDDGIPGERVTPTGAAILRHLGCGAAESAGPHAGSRTLARSGTGFGTKELPGISNCLRLLASEEQPASAARPGAAASHAELAVLSFEVDDQSAEDLAIGLDRLRAVPSVADVIQMPAFGKKGRMAAHIRVLADPAGLDEAIAACFRETTTIGLRYQMVRGVALARRTDRVEVDGRPVRVKTVERPGGRTAKAETDDVADAAYDGGRAARDRVRRGAEAEAQALAPGDARTSGESGQGADASGVLLSTVRPPT